MDSYKYREMMVLGQIETAGVTSQSILNSFREVPREIFAPHMSPAVTYRDEDCSIGSNRILMEPAVQARLIQALEVKPSDVVLDVGGATGYSSALFSKIATTVVMIEDDKEMQAQAEKNLLQLDASNVVVFSGLLTKGCPLHAPFDVIFINGACAHIPEALIEQLSSGGRLACVLQERRENMGKATLFSKNDDGIVSMKSLFDANIPYMDGFAPEPGFVL
ncbi:MAG: protein-L-isoaspartate O-methyltransferase [Alphaproteobacteria bacterium]|nr:protein-L-isoaspartate O-methyltransferase [Alphaproteobacteria bacterium]|tara:strand:+ start:2418 stop:3077 length:660 start_codon:yes stop_codon:yes gene_type:complete